jgi:hypothetical protein
MLPTLIATARRRKFAISTICSVIEAAQNSPIVSGWTSC